MNQAALKRNKQRLDFISSKVYGTGAEPTYADVTFLIKIARENLKKEEERLKWSETNES